MAAAPALNVLAWSLAMTRKTDTPTELAWEYATQSIPERGLPDERKASPEELAAIARALELLACKSLSAAFTIMPTVDGRYHLTGTLRADITQACVVTLDPVDSAIEEAFDVTFWPERDMPAPSGGALDIDEEPDPEPIVAGQIAVGRVVFEHLAAAIDPFPRMPDAALEQDTATGAAGAPGTSDSPFAVLANIKPRT
jgi:Large ribosomal RNA subunit accumulation protein YceD